MDDLKSPKVVSMILIDQFRPLAALNISLLLSLSRRKTIKFHDLKRLPGHIESKDNNLNAYSSKTTKTDFFNPDWSMTSVCKMACRKIHCCTRKGKENKGEN